jgi:hypothetical protein
VLSVEEPMVVPAQQDQVVVLGCAVIEPVVGMVCIAATGRDAAAGPATAVVADHELVELGVGNGSAALAVVDDGSGWIGDVTVD